MSTVNFHSLWQEQCDAHMAVAQETFSLLEPIIQEWITQATHIIQEGGKIMFCGNGGSAGDAQHIAAELSVRFIDDRPPIAGLCLSLDPSAITACANDFGYEYIFARQIEALGNPGDMLVGISTSGKSPNILKALEMAKTKTIHTVGLTGKAGDPMKDLCDIFIQVPALKTANIQEMHIFLGHVFCAGLEQALELKHAA